MIGVLHWLGHAVAWTWGDRAPGTGVGYAITSGPLPDLTMLGALGLWWRHHSCHVTGCHRLSWRATSAGDRVCRRHHPHGPKTHAQVIDDHLAAEDCRGR